MTEDVMTNTRIWDQIRRVPPEHLKGFQRPGGFKGTAIKPMWTIQRMTEVFGPCGKGWGMGEPQFNVVPAGDEIMVYCTVGAWHGSPAQTVYGVGGDKVLIKNASGARSDDEAFKKAYTDALTNALKMIGAGADVHMGLWDGNKYVDDNGTPAGAMVNGTHGASKAASRQLYDAYVKDIRNASTVHGLTAWFKANASDIDKMPPDWIDELRIEYSDRMKDLKQSAAA